MPGFGNGVNRGVGMVVEALIVGILLGKVVPTLVEAGLLPKYMFTLFMVASIISTVAVVGNALYWSFGYLAGVCIAIPLAIDMLWQTGFLGPLDLVLYSVVIVGSMAVKVRAHT